MTGRTTAVELINPKKALLMLEGTEPDSSSEIADFGIGQLSSITLDYHRPDR